MDADERHTGAAGGQAGSRRDEINLRERRGGVGEGRQVGGTASRRRDHHIDRTRRMSGAGHGDGAAAVGVAGVIERDDGRGGAAEGDRAGAEEVDAAERHTGATGGQAGIRRDDINLWDIGEEVGRHALAGRHVGVGAGRRQHAVTPAGEVVADGGHRSDGGAAGAGDHRL